MYTWELGAVKLVEAEQVAIVRNVDLAWNEEHFWNYFETIKMKDNVVDIQLGYDVSHLYSLIRQREEVKRLLTRYKDLHVEEPDSEHIYNTGYCCGDKVDGLEYYSCKLDECDEALRMERNTIRTIKRCNFAFVVWTSPGNCKMFINTHKPVNICKVIKEEKQFRSQKWQVRLAPIHYDIMWDNMSTPKWFWWTRAAVINLILLLFVIFFTTPLIIISFITVSLQIRLYMSTFYYVYFTILLLILLTNILPEIVNWTCKLEKHRTKSGYFHWMLKKAFVYLLISIELLPLVGDTSIANFFEEIFSSDWKGFRSIFQCVFSVYNSAFFCNLILAAAFVGRSIELLQIKGIYIYIWERSFARTKREYLKIFKKIKRDFNIGYNYAKLQAYLCVVISFSLICPIITAYGMLLLVIKYAVDKYLMIYKTGPCGSYSSSTHYTSAYFTVFSGVLLQIFMFLYAFMYCGLEDGRTILSGIVLLLILVFLATKLLERVYHGLFPLSPNDRDFISHPEANFEQLKDTYLPGVINSDTHRQKRRAKRVYSEHNRAYSMSSITALLDTGLSANYKSIVGSISGMSMRSHTSISNSPVITSLSSSNPEISTSPSHRDDHVTSLSPETPDGRSSQDTATLEIENLSDTEINNTSDNEFGISFILDGSSAAGSVAVDSINSGK
ncbi:CSC1-like protein 1 [Bolinopsis microptera]|uniref:CSC1-like protein 1 n=1 Tax=Bolinopsis microptera TaxID=2820187 RepID=UPI003078EDE9